MRRSWAAAMLFMASCVAPVDGPPDVSADLVAIEALHQVDMEAVRNGDTDALLDLWSNDPMALPPDGEILEGREAIADMLRSGRRRDDSPWELAEYTQSFSEVRVVGPYAWDLGTVRTRLVHRTRGTEVTLNGKLLRILERQADDTWKVHRSAWSAEPPDTTDP